MFIIISCCCSIGGQKSKPAVVPVPGPAVVPVPELETDDDTSAPNKRRKKGLFILYLLVA
jgi:hypothetical protein